MKYSDSLRGYGHNTNIKCNFRCQYCGYDGRSFPNWFQLSLEHIKPKSQGGNDEKENLITICQACNSITSRMQFSDDMSIDQIKAEKIKRVRERQTEYFEFWKTEVAPKYLHTWEREREMLEKERIEKERQKLEEERRERER